MSTVDLGPMFPASLVMTGADQALRRSERMLDGKHRVWYVTPRYGTAESDRWTVVGVPMPGASNPASDIEDGQFPSLADAYEARAECERIDDGTHGVD
jgi:hypothetical protein